MKYSVATQLPAAFTYHDGIYFAEASLWLDAHRAQSLAVVSHAHSDHVRRHDHTIATPATAELIRLRYGSRMDVEALPFFRPLDIGSVRITLFPSGHVLGSAQVLVEKGGTRYLYSGDLRLRPSRTSDAAQVPAADVLIMETTYGRPRYVFPSEQAVAATIDGFCEAAFQAGDVPVCYAYSLGKAQEAIALLDELGYRVAAHPSILEINAVYRRHGVALPECSDLSAAPSGRMVVVCPPQARRWPSLQHLGRYRTSVLTGWALDSGAKFRYQSDAAIPLTDHAGFDDLLRYVDLTGAREVYTVHGYTREFAAELQRRGIAAYPLDRPMQLTLPGIPGMPGIQ